MLFLHCLHSADGLSFRIASSPCPPLRPHLEPGKILTSWPKSLSAIHPLSQSYFLKNPFITDVLLHRTKQIPRAIISTSQVKHRKDSIPHCPPWARCRKGNHNIKWYCFHLPKCQLLLWLIFFDRVCMIQDSNKSVFWSNFFHCSTTADLFNPRNTMISVGGGQICLASTINTWLGRITQCIFQIHIFPLLF